MTFSNRTSLVMDSTLRPLVAALLVVTAMLGGLLLAAPADADQLAPAMKGSEQYKIPGKVKDKQKFAMSLLLEPGGHLQINVDDESWDLVMIGSGPSAQFQMTSDEFEAMEAAIANDLRSRYAAELVDPSEKARLDSMLAEQNDLAAKASALDAARREAEQRLASFVSGGGPVPFDILQMLQADVNRLNAEYEKVRGEALDLSVQINAQRQFLSPPFEVTVSAFTLRLKFNKPETKAKVLAKIEFSARNLTTGEYVSGSRKVKGKGQILDLR